MPKQASLFLAQPHKPFFTLATVNALIMMFLFMLAMHGDIHLSVDLLLFHAYSLIFTVFTPLFMGFLLTTFPRFNQTAAIDKTLYTKLFYALIIGNLLFVSGSFLSFWLLIFATIMIACIQTALLYLFIRIYKSSPLQDKHDSFWILISWSMGIAAGLLFFTPLSTLAVMIAVYLYATMLALSIAQRMVPFFSHIMIEKNRELLKMVFTLFSLMSIMELFDLKIGFFFLLVAGILILKEILRWKLPLSLKEPILWILHLALFWLPTALILGAFSQLAALIFEKDFFSLSIHLVMLGFLTTLFIGFGTRVTLGHSGNQMRIDNYTKILFYLTQIVVYFRALYSFSGSTLLFDISAALWIALFAAWGLRYLPVLITDKKLS